MAKRDVRPSLIDILLRPFFHILKIYFIKRGFMDGVRGLLIAVLGGVYVFLKYTKLWEIRASRNKKMITVITILILISFLPGLLLNSRINYSQSPNDTLKVVQDTITTAHLDSANMVTADSKYHPPYRVSHDIPFKEGEKLTFSIGYGFINAGTAVMQVESREYINKREVFHITSRTRSNRFFDHFFKVRDTVETFVDAVGLFSWKFSKKIKEGKYRSNYWINFDHEKNLAYTSSDTLKVPHFTQDVLSSFYFVRSLNLKVGKTEKIITLDNDELYPLNVKVLRKEKVKTVMGELECFVVEPLLKSGGLFKHKGTLKIWLTADSKKIPVMMKSKALIGSITARLKKVEGVDMGGSQ
jgi:hypothetical protein